MRKMTEVLGKFVDQKFIKKMVLTDLIHFDVTKSHKYNAMPEMGTKTNIILSKLNNLQRKKFEDEVATPFFASSTIYLLEKVPLDNQLILDAKYLHPKYMRPKKVSAEPICQLTSTACGKLGKAVHSAYGSQIWGQTSNT